MMSLSINLSVDKHEFIQLLLSYGQFSDDKLSLEFSVSTTAQF